MQSSSGIDKLELEYRKLIVEYNALLIALASATIGFGVFLYTLTKNNNISIIGLMICFFIIDSFKNEKAGELKEKIKELNQ